MSRVAGGMSITMGMIDYVGNFAGMVGRWVIWGGLIVGRSRWRSPSFSWIRHYGQPQFRLECVLRPARRKDRALRSEGALVRTEQRRNLCGAGLRLLWEPGESGFS
jgi:hypothetical protein